MTRRLFTAALLPLTFAALVAGCGSSSSNSSSSGNAATPASSSNGGNAYGGASGAPASTAPASSGSLTISTHSTPIGTVLVGANGRTIYLFMKDSAGKSSCSGACASAWPPVTGTAAAGSGVTAAKLTTFTRSDGSKQVVYGGHPLYYFVSDTAAGDTKGQGVHAFGADWYMVGPAGSKVEKPGS